MFATAEMIELYKPLLEWLAKQPGPKVRLTTSEIEDIVGRSLPDDEVSRGNAGYFGLKQVVGYDWLTSIRGQQLTFKRHEWVESIEETRKPRARVVALRKGGNGRYLDATMSRGSLVITGQDLGSGTSSISGDGEYEWSYSISKANIPKLLELLGAKHGENILDVLERWKGRKAARFEEITEENKLRSNFWSWSG